MSDQVREWIDEVIARTVAEFTQEDYAEEWDLEGLVKQMAALYDTEVTVEELREDLGEVTRESLMEEFQEDARDSYTAKEEELTTDPDARARALRDPPGRRPTLARALDSMDYLRRASTYARWHRNTRSSSTATKVTSCSRSLAARSAKKSS